MAIEISEISYCGIPFEIKENSSSSTHYILIHGDEQTAKILINEHIKKNKVTSLKRLLNIVFFIEFKSFNTYIALSRID